MKTYNHAYTIAFEVRGSTSEEGEEVTNEQLAVALRQRVEDCIAENNLIECCGAPFDTYEEE